MSGGSLDYFYLKLEELDFRQQTPQRKAFKRHLVLVAQALHDIEWVDSGDYSEGAESEAIEACLHPKATLLEAYVGVRDAVKTLTEVMRRQEPPA